MNNSQTCCAHSRIILKRMDHLDGTRSDYWECDSGCGCKFYPETHRIFEKVATPPKNIRVADLKAKGVAEKENYLHDDISHSPSYRKEHLGQFVQSALDEQAEEFQKQLVERNSWARDVQQAAKKLEVEHDQLTTRVKELEIVRDRMKHQRDQLQANYDSLLKSDNKRLEQVAQLAARVTELMRYQLQMDVACRVGTATERQIETNRACLIEQENNQLRKRVKELESQQEAKITPSLIMDYAKVQKECDQLRNKVKEMSATPRTDAILVDYLVEVLEMAQSNWTNLCFCTNLTRCQRCQDKEILKRLLASLKE